MTPPPQHDTEILIVGAGMAGLSAATELQRAGRRVLVLDKGRGVGGRVATRRIDQAVFDHGAQFMTARSARFQSMIDDLHRQEVLVEWCRGFTNQPDGHPRWRGNQGMTSVPKRLAQNVDVRLEQHVTSLSEIASGWLARTKEGHTFTAGALLLTAPVPQSLALLDTGGCVLDERKRAQLDAIAYERCLVVMALLNGPSLIPSPGGQQFTDGPISWLADNQTKGISSVPAVTIHASHSFSVEHWHSDRLQSGRELLQVAAPWLGASVKEFQVHAWRYSKPLRVAAGDCLVANTSPPLVFAGDAFAGSRVEGAVLSGWAAADILKRF